MTRLHKLHNYKDGYKVVEYCCVCSAEGDTLLEDCPGNFPNPVRTLYFRDMTKEEFEEKYQKTLDAASLLPINRKY